VIGRRTLKDVAGLLRQLVSLQRSHNWCRQKGKQQFGRLKLAAVVCSK